MSPEYEIDRKGFRYRTVELVVSGSGTVELGSRELPLALGVCFCYGPTVYHHIRTDPLRPLVKYFLNFTGDDAVRMLESGPLGSGEPAWVPDINQLCGVLEFLHENGGSTASAAPICNRLVEVFLLKLAEVGRSIDDLPNRGAASTFQAILRYMRDDFLRIGSVGQVATHFDVSQGYVTRLFRRFKDTTPHDYLRHLKMSHAASLLVSNGCRVKEVAERLGYSDAFHFSRAFKAEFGYPPSELVDRLRSRE